MKSKPSRWSVFLMVGVFSALVLGVYLFGSVLQMASSEEEGAARAARDETVRRDNYYPNTEPLGADEILRLPPPFPFSGTRVALHERGAPC